MKIYFDTEFLEDGKTIELISIGMVREDGEELYCINKDCDWKRVYNDAWLYEKVVPHLDKPGSESWLSKKDIASKIINFTYWDTPKGPLFVCPKSRPLEFWAYYASYDWVVLCQI